MGNPSKAKLGKAATKASYALKARRQEENDRRAAAKKELDDLEKAAAAEAALNRKAERDGLRQIGMSVKERLGRMVIANIRRHGLEGSLLAGSELNSWPESHRAELHAILAHAARPQAVDPVPLESAPPLDNVDIDLDQ